MALGETAFAFVSSFFFRPRQPATLPPAKNMLRLEPEMPRVAPLPVAPMIDVGSDAWASDDPPVRAAPSRRRTSRVETKSPRPRPIHFKCVDADRIVTPAKAVDYLIEYMNAEGCTGLFAAEEINEAWRITAALYDLVELDPNMVREAMEGRGLRLGHKRLNTPEYLHIRQRLGLEHNRANARRVLYKIPKYREDSGQNPAVTPAENPETETAKPDLKKAAPHTRPEDSADRPIRTPATAEQASDQGGLADGAPPRVREQRAA